MLWPVARQIDRCSSTVQHTLLTVNMSVNSCSSSEKAADDDFP
jgi:hypothetical protein